MAGVDSDEKNIDFVQFNRKNMSAVRLLMRPGTKDRAKNAELNKVPNT